MKTTIAWSALALLLVAAPGLAQTHSRGQEPSEAHEQQGEEHEAARVGTPAAPYAQWLIDRTVTGHKALKAMELAVELHDTCRTVAATEADEVGETCGKDDTDVMRSGKANVESPSKREPVYEVTEALHDGKGTVIGVLSMDLDASGLDRAKALALAQSLLAEVEAKIPTRDKLFEAAP